MQQTTKQKMLFVLLLVPFIWAQSNSMIIPILPQAQRQQYFTLSIRTFNYSTLEPNSYISAFDGFLSIIWSSNDYVSTILLRIKWSGNWNSYAFKSYPLMIIVVFQVSWLFLLAAVFCCPS